MASDFLFGWFTGLMTILLPYLAWEVLRLRRKIRFLAHPKEEEAVPAKKKSWWKL